MDLMKGVVPGPALQPVMGVICTVMRNSASDSPPCNVRGSSQARYGRGHCLSL